MERKKNKWTQEFKVRRKKERKKIRKKERM